MYNKYESRQAWRPTKPFLKVTAVAMISVNYLSDDDAETLHRVAMRLSYQTGERHTKSSLARQIVLDWIRDNATPEDRPGKKLGD